MSNDIKKYSEQLRQILDDYYHNQISLEDYRAQRKFVLDSIEHELAGADSDEDRKDSGME